jgi:hypothetical protein
VTRPNEPPRLSALIVNFHTYGEIAACLGSLAAALDPARDEILVVDHGSDPAALGALAARFPAVRWLPTAQNPGFGAGINRAARAASGQRLLVLNPDATISSNLPAQLAATLDSAPDIAIVGPLVRTGDGRLEASARRFPGWSTVFGGRSTWLTRVWPGNPFSRRNLLTGPEVTAPVDVDWVSGACLLVRRDVFEALGGFDEQFFMYWEDADLCRRARAAGRRVVYEPRATVTHLGGRASRQRSRASAAAFHQSVFRYYMKHGGALRHLGAPIVYVALRARLAWVQARTTSGG